MTVNDTSPAYAGQFPRRKPPIFPFLIFFSKFENVCKKGQFWAPLAPPLGHLPPCGFFYYFGIERVCNVLEFQLSTANICFNIFEKPWGGAKSPSSKMGLKRPQKFSISLENVCALYICSFMLTPL